MERRLSDRVTLICVRTVQPYALRVTGHHQKLNLKCLNARSRTSSYYRLMLLPLIPLPARFAATHTHQRICRAASMSIKLQQSITSSVRQHVKDWLASLWILRRVKSLPQVSPNLLVIQRRNMENSAAHFRLIGIRNIRGLNTAYNMMQPFAFVADGLRRALNARVVQVRHL